MSLVPVVTLPILHSHMWMVTVSLVITGPEDTSKGRSKYTYFEDSSFGTTRKVRYLPPGL